ncbi:MAG: ribulose-phosphate 3-epimerase [Candidatus Limnocylindria bacterium]
MKDRPAQISASLLNADHAQLGHEVRRAVDAGVDSIHLDVMDGHFVQSITIGPAVVGAVRPFASLPFHTHLMVSQPLRQARAFADAGSDLIVAHVEADDDPGEVIAAIHGYGRGAGLAINPETPAEAVLRYLDGIDLLLLMTVHPGRGGQAFLPGVLPKVEALRAEIERRGLSLPIGVDGGVNLDTIGPAHAAGAEVMVAGSAIYREAGDLGPTVQALRAAAEA